MEIPDALVGDREVFMVLIWHSMKPLDLGQREEVVMWSKPCMIKNLEKGSQEKGGTLSQKNHLGVPYCEKGLVSIALYCQKSWNELCI